MFIKLTTLKGISHILNSRQIVEIEPHESGSTITLDSLSLGQGNNTAIYQEKPEAICAMLNGSTSSPDSEFKRALQKVSDILSQSFEEEEVVKALAIADFAVGR